MQPEAQAAMRRALALGPGHCPPDLFHGSVASIVRGLQAHANTIAHARHLALEQTYPRTRTLMGAESFHRAATKHLADAAVLRWPLGRIGEGFPARLTGRVRNLAAIEWAWLESHGAPDAPPLDLPAIAGLDPQSLVRACVALHPATRLVAIGGDAPLEWDGLRIRSTHVLVTRPTAEVAVTAADEAVARLVELLDCPRSLGELLAEDAGAATILVATGALAEEIKP